MLLFLLTLAGSVALLLWGLNCVQSGMQRAFGARFRVFLSATLGRRWTAFGAGLAVTAALQSSAATALMTTGFVSAGWVALAPALAVMLGAHVGTTLIVQALAFPVTALAPALAVGGFVLVRRGRGRFADIGSVLLGFSLVLLALHHIVGAIAPQASSPTAHLLLEQLSQQPGLSMVAALLLAWAAHSSVAIVLLAMSLAAQGAVPLPTALAFVLGANLGSSLIPLFEGEARNDAAARRLPAGDLALRVAGALAVLPWLDSLAAGFAGFGIGRAHAVALFHTIFNLALAAVFLPWLTPYSRLLERCFPNRAGDASLAAAPRYLSGRAHEAPVIALARAARETLRLADELERMLIGLRHAFEFGEREQIKQTRSIDDVLDRLNRAIKAHVTRLDFAGMSEPDRRRAVQILAFATHLEQAGDLIDARLLSMASKRVKRGLAFSPEGRAELLELIDRLQVNIRSAASVFISADPRAARLLAQEKDAIRRRVSAATHSHFSRLRSGRISSIETSTLHLDMLHVLKQVNSHLVEGAAYPLLEGAGELLPSRLKEVSAPDGTAPQV